MRLLTDKLKVDKRYLFLMDDIDEALDDIRKEYGENKNIYGIGFSYGANQMVKYLGQKKLYKKENNSRCIYIQSLRIYYFIKIMLRQAI